VRGVLFDDYDVAVHPETAQWGGSFYALREDGRLQAWEPGLIRFFWGKIKDHTEPMVLDIGASTGSYTLLAAHHSAMQVWAFEPQPHIARVLLANIDLNGLQARAHAVNVALGNAIEQRFIHVPSLPTQAGLACLGEPKRYTAWEDVPCDCLTLDHWMPPDLHIDFMKVDTEGAELFILRGGEKTIRRHKPGILMEYEPRNTAQFGYDVQEITQLLSSWGATIEKIGAGDIWATWV
jgi:FkbM family methyltransferase